MGFKPKPGVVGGGVFEGWCCLWSWLRPAGSFPKFDWSRTGWSLRYERRGSRLYVLSRLLLDNRHPDGIDRRFDRWDLKHSGKFLIGRTPVSAPRVGAPGSRVPRDSEYLNV